MQATTHYALSKLMHDLYTNRVLAAEYLQDRRRVLARYELDDHIVAALVRDDVERLAPLVNGFLLRYYFVVVGMSDPEFLRRIRSLRRG